MDPQAGASERERERRKAVKRFIVELYNAPRVTAAAKMLPGMRHLPGLALDLATADADGDPLDFCAEGDG